MEINVLVNEGLAGCLEESWLEEVARQTLVIQGVESRVELGLVIVGQAKVRQLNLSYLGKDETTDVLTFALLSEQSGDVSTPFVVPPDGMQHLGEVIVSYPQAVIQAEKHRHSVKREVAFLIIHGILHLLGYDHDKLELEREMRTREREILGYLEGKLV